MSVVLVSFVFISLLVFEKSLFGFNLAFEKMIRNNFKLSEKQQSFLDKIVNEAKAKFKC